MTTFDTGIGDWHEAESSTVALFTGDRGGLSRPQRDCLVYLLKHRYVSHDQRPDLWNVLVEHRPLIESRLNDLFLSLQVDLVGQVAYKRQAVPDNPTKSFPTLLHDSAYTREETVVLVFLRGKLQRERAAGGGPALVDREELLERVAEFRAPDATDLVAEQRRAEKTIDALVKMDVLYAGSEQDRFVISPVLDSLMPLAKLQELRDWLLAENADPDDDTNESTDVVESADTTDDDGGAQ